MRMGLVFDSISMPGSIDGREGAGTNATTNPAALRILTLSMSSGEVIDFGRRVDAMLRSRSMVMAISSCSVIAPT